MIISPGEKIHIVSRPLFEEDTRRHFIGEVINAEGDLVRARGYVFVLDRRRERFHKLPELRIRIFGFRDARLIVNVIPNDTDLDTTDCRVNDQSRLVVSDGKSFSLDIHEFYEQRSHR